MLINILDFLNDRYLESVGVPADEALGETASRTFCQSAPRRAPQNDSLLCRGWKGKVAKVRSDSFHTLVPPPRPCVRVVSGNLINCCLVITRRLTRLEASIVVVISIVMASRQSYQLQPAKSGSLKRLHLANASKENSVGAIQILAALVSQICRWKQKRNSQGFDVEAEFKKEAKAPSASPLRSPSDRLPCSSCLHGV